MAPRDVRLYLLELPASLIGTSAMTLVAAVWVESLTGGSATAGLVSVCVFAPALLAGLLADRVVAERGGCPPGGCVSDRSSRKARSRNLTASARSAPPW